MASAAAHGALLVVGLVAFSSPPKFADQQEAIAVEVISEEAFSTMTQGERMAKTVQDNPKPRVDRVADVEERKPDPGEAKRDVPAPVARPPAPDKSEDRAAAEPAPAPPEPAPPQPAAPAPEPEPVKPEPQAAVPPPPLPQPRPQQIAQAQPSAPAPEKPEPPKPEPAKPEPAKPEPAKPEPAKPEPAKPEPPKPQPPKPAPPRPEPKPKPEPKPEPKPKPEPRASAPAREPAKPASRSQSDRSFDPDAIEKLLASRDSAQSAGSTGRERQAASAGTRTGNAPKLSLSQRDAIGNLMKSQISRCFSAPPGLADVRTSPVVRVSLNQDGTLAGPPEVISGASDPASRSFAESLMRAIRRCAPYSFPAQYAPYYQDWRDWRIDASPGDFLG